MEPLPVAIRSQGTNIAETADTRLPVLHAVSHASYDQLIYGGGEEEERGCICTFLELIGTCIAALGCCILCWPCLLCCFIAECFKTDEAQAVDDKVRDLVKVLREKDPATLPGVAMPDVYCDRVELILKNIIFELKKLEEKLRIAPLNERKAIKEKILENNLPGYVFEYHPFIQYQTLLYQYRKLHQAPDPAETARHCLMAMIQDLIERELHTELNDAQMSGIRTRHGSELGLVQDPLLQHNPQDDSKTLQECKDMLGLSLTKTGLMRTLKFRLNFEKGNIIFCDWLLQRLESELEEKRILQQDVPDADEYIRQFIEEGKFTEIGVEKLLEALPPLFDDHDAFIWENIKLLQPPYPNLEENDVTGIQLEELIEIRKRVSAQRL